MFDDIVVEEVSDLLSKGYEDNKSIMKAIGVRELRSFLNKEINLEALLFRLRQRISNRSNKELKGDKLGLYICSLSSKTIVYKGM